MRKNNLLLSSLLLIAILTPFSCSKKGVEPTNACDSTGAPGPLFSQVKSMMQSNCVSCHNSSNANGGMDWTIDCNIVVYKDHIKAHANDNVPVSMPPPPNGPLPQVDKDKITNWINAGGRYTD